ncbi:hypothetical protein BGZ76_001339 [Entomortierella beljakovae]|nr:hypothetical protein BGZ76_001339 [Entomortierella beljakovae]
MPLSLTSTLAIDEDLSLALQLSTLEENPTYEEEQCFDVSDDDSTLDNLEQFYDYRDIRLSLPTHKPKQKKQKAKSIQLTPKTAPRPAPFTNIIQPIIDCPKPLVFPLEILVEVCSNLSQSTLRTCVRLVCKDWYTVSYQFIRRFGIWSPLSEGGSSQLLRQMNKKLDTLECWFNIDPNVPDSIEMLNQQLTLDRWRVFRETILAPLEEGTRSNNVIALKNGRVKSTQIQQHQNYPIVKSSYKCLLHRVRNLSIRGCYVDFSEVLVALSRRGGFKFLKTLFIDIHQGHRDLFLFSLLDDCPNLIEFKVRVPNRTKVNIINGDMNDFLPLEVSGPANPETAHFPVRPKPILPPKTYDQQYNLRIFDIENCQIRQFVLERVVSTCPQLRVFKAKGINRNAWSEVIGDRIHYPVNYDRLLKHAKDVCPSLEWFHITLDQYILSDPDHIERVNKYSPEAKYLTLTLGGYLNPRLTFLSMPATKELFGKITVLELTGSKSSLRPSLLNDILCMTPNLLHYKGPDYRFILDRLYSAPATKVDKSKVWSCYDLRSLDMNLRDFMYPHPEASIIKFTKYIERHRLFRNLVDLRLYFCNLHIGQLTEFPHVVKEREEERNKFLQKIHPLDKSKQMEKSTPDRFENYFDGLRGLRSLEYISLTAVEIPGMIHYSDFEFLRRENNNETIIHVVSHDVDDDDYQDQVSRGDSDSQGSEDACSQENVPAETIWPRLQTFYIYYEIQPAQSSFGGIASYMEVIRPGIDFLLKQKYSFLRYV